MKLLHGVRPVYLVFVFALLIRLVYVLFVPQLSLSGSDAMEYDLAAEGLLRGEGFPVERLSAGQVEIVRPPLFPLFLALIYKVFGHNYTAVRLIQAFLAAFTVFFIYGLARQALNSEAAALWGAFLYSAYPSLIAYTGLLYSETIFIFFLTASMFLLGKAVKSGKVVFFVYSGITLGLATMISSRSLYMPVFIFFGLLFCLKNKAKAVKYTLAIMLMMLAVFLPWTIRNYFVSGGKFILLENYSSATALWLATNPQGEILEWNYDKEPLKSLVGGLPQEERTPAIRRQALKNLKKYPLAYVKNSFRRFFVLLLAGHSNCFRGLEEPTRQAFADGEYAKAVLKSFLFIFNVAIIIFGFSGIWIARKRWAQALALLIPIAYTVSLHTLYVAAPRLQIPMMPFLLVFTALFFTDMLNLRKGARNG